MDKYLVHVTSTTQANALSTTSSNNPNKVYFDNVNQVIWNSGKKFGLGNISWGG